MLQALQADDIDNPKSRRRVDHRLPTMTKRLLLAAVTGMTSGLMRAVIDWLLQVLGS
ncbi:hypothetical protein Apa02nite_091380 [Actinoplanes palleronii]|uniref:Uncharacterized protein n=1 Tax=Actinoplanes palleronii TaxID=113570 RepID=A0ABQ4BS67_9ACTN|nr:hypothetical protein Apa02nite_091380 [Actinoplanes palleronii]